MATGRADDAPRPLLEGLALLDPEFAAAIPFRSVGLVALLRLAEWRTPDRAVRTSVREALAKGSGMTVEQVADCPIFLTGSPAEVRDRLEWRREQTGISYVVVQASDPERIESFAEHVVSQLDGK